MRPVRSILAVALLGVGFSAGLWYLFQAQFAEGSVYPARSSLRADADGAKVLYESLAGLPALTVARTFEPLERLTGTGVTVFLLGLVPSNLEAETDLRPLDRFAARGNRLVISLEPPAGRHVPPGATLDRIWGIRMDLEPRKDGRRVLYFAAARDWDVLDSGPTGPRVVARQFGKGSIVLAADSRVFSNAAMAESPRLELLARTAGPYSTILFDEAHFGLVESGSIVEMARRFRMGGLALGLALCAALLVWRNASGFPPARPLAVAEHVSGRTSVSGLVTLLRRHVRPADLATVCWREWLKTHAREISADRRAAVEAVLDRFSGHPVESLAEILAILRAKGTV